MKSTSVNENFKRLHKKEKMNIFKTVLANNVLMDYS